MINEIWSVLIEGLLASSAALLLVLATRPLWRRFFGATTLPLIWAAVPLALIAVWLPGPSVPLAEVEDVWQLAGLRVVADLPQASTTTTASEIGISTLIAIWLLGCLWFAVRQIGQQRGFYRRLGVVVQRGPRLSYSSRSDIGPAVLGLLRPSIVLPADFEQRYAADQRELILAHERSHLARGDIIANAVAAVLRCIYWFNPLIHFAAARLRQDHELASDADVLRQFPLSRRRYADTLLDVQLAVPGLPVGCLWQSSHALKERIVMMKKTTINAGRSRLGMGVAVLFLSAVACASWAGQPSGAAGEKVDAPAETAAAVKPEAPAKAEAGSAVDEPIDYSKLATPKYPKSAMDAGLEGTVVVGILVSPAGDPLKVWVERSSETEALDEAAMAAVKSWKLAPAMENGKAVQARIVVPICFSLDDEFSCESSPKLDAPPQSSPKEPMSLSMLPMKPFPWEPAPPAPGC